MKLEKIRLKRVLGPGVNGSALILGSKRKNFMMHVGPFETYAIIRELNKEPPPRPLTHELLYNIIDGFSINVKKIVISNLIKNAYCATLVLDQMISDGDDKPLNTRHEVRIDARPSDCIVIALKTGKDIYISKELLDKLADVSHLLKAKGVDVNGYSVDDEPHISFEEDKDETEYDEEV